MPPNLSWLLASWFSFLALFVQQPMRISSETAALPHFARRVSDFYRALFTMQLKFNIGQLSELFLITPDCGGP